MLSPIMHDTDKDTAELSVSVAISKAEEEGERKVQIP